MTDPIGSMSDRYAHMRELIRSWQCVVVAYSGGVDSAFVLKVCVDVLGAGNVLAATGRSPSVPTAELTAAAELAAAIGAQHAFVETNEFGRDEYLSNPTNRCYFCKETLYSHLEPVAREFGATTIVNGANLDDLGDHRPGMQAALEFSVRAPAAEALLSKADIRELSRELGLPTADKPASPCLSSRVPYGEPITVEKLRRIERGEAFLHELGFRECRVRHHGQVARIEVPPADIDRLLTPAIRRRIDEQLREIGFLYVTVDLRGLRSGSLNDVVRLQLQTRACESETTG